MDTSKYSFLAIDVRDSIAFVTFNRPEDGNRFSRAEERELSLLVRDLENDSSVRVVVLTGAGDTFCLGAHHSDDPWHPLELYNRYLDLFSSYVTLDTPIVGAMNGPASGQGLTMALLLTDILIAEEHVEFVDAHVTNSSVSATGSFIWPTLVGVAKAKRFLMTGDPLPAREAAEIGLIAEVVETGQSLRRATEIAQRLASLSPDAVRGTKRAINLTRRNLLGLLHEALAVQFLSASESHSPGDAIKAWDEPSLTSPNPD